MMEHPNQPNAQGENNGNARLSTADVVALRLMHRQFMQNLANEYKISKSHLHRIIAGNRWSHRVVEVKTT